MEGNYELKWKRNRKIINNKAPDRKQSEKSWKQGDFTSREAYWELEGFPK